MLLRNKDKTKIINYNKNAYSRTYGWIGKPIISNIYINRIFKKIQSTLFNREESKSSRTICYAQCLLEYIIG